MADITTHTPTFRRLIRSHMADITTNTHAYFQTVDPVTHGRHHHKHTRPYFQTDNLVTHGRHHHTHALTSRRTISSHMADITTHTPLHPDGQSRHTWSTSPFTHTLTSRRSIWSHMTDIRVSLELMSPIIVVRHKLQLFLTCTHKHLILIGQRQWSSHKYLILIGYC